MRLCLFTEPKIIIGCHLHKSCSAVCFFVYLLQKNMVNSFISAVKFLLKAACHKLVKNEFSGSSHLLINHPVLFAYHAFPGMLHNQAFIAMEFVNNHILESNEMSSVPLKPCHPSPIHTKPAGSGLVLG